MPAPKLKCPTCQEFTIKTRKELARSLVESRMRVYSLKRKAQKLRIDLERSLKNITENWVDYHQKRLAGMVDINQYPLVPPGTIIPTRNGDSLPHCSGIYFFWNSEEVQYVGQSENINHRVRLIHHSYLQETDLISFIPFKLEYVDWAECYYIGVLRPVRNFNVGKRRRQEPIHRFTLKDLKRRNRID